MIADLIRVQYCMLTQGSSVVVLSFLVRTVLIGVLVVAK